MKFKKIIFYTFKQFILSPVIWIILFVIPVTTFLLNSYKIGSDNASITAAYYINTELDSNSKYYTDKYKENRFYSIDEIQKETQIINNALKAYKGLYKFIPVSSEEEVYKLINKHEANCGYIFDKDFLAKFLINNSKETITVINNGNISLSSLINETIYSIIFSEISKMKTTDYLLNNDNTKELFIENKITQNDINDIYNEIKNDENNFHFVYEGAPQNYIPETSEILFTPFRGILSLIILISGFSGSIYFYKYKNNTLYKNIKIRISYIIIPIILSSFVSFISIIISDKSTGVINEISSLLIYDIIVFIFILLLTVFIKNITAIYALIPFIIIFSFVFTPIIFDITAFIPILKPITYIFPTKYYLMFFG